MSKRYSNPSDSVGELDSSFEDDNRLVIDLGDSATDINSNKIVHGSKMASNQKDSSLPVSDNVVATSSKVESTYIAAACSLPAGAADTFLHPANAPLRLTKTKEKTRSKRKSDNSQNPAPKRSGAKKRPTKAQLSAAAAASTANGNLASLNCPGGGSISISGAPNRIKMEPGEDPYTFNTRFEDNAKVPAIKRVKVEKTMTPPIGVQYPTREVAVETLNVGVSTDPDCLGPCEPGTNVNLEGIVWNETKTGVLVVNITWRGKTYVGTLLDATKHDWAPPRLSCESPVDVNAPKGRTRRRCAAPAPPFSL